MFSILLASPRWYCAGVDRAIGMLDDILEAYGAPVYVNHEIVHNKLIVSYFEKKWVIFSDDLDVIPSGSIMVFSAHGVAPSFVREAKSRWLRCIDASCPLVIKVHNEAKKFISEGYKIIYIGKKDHQEAIGVADNDLENIYVVGNKQEADKLDFEAGQKLALLNQTTLSVDDTKDLINYISKLYPEIRLPGFSDICYATTNRQEVVKILVKEVDALIIVWSENSSNSVKLRLIGEKAGIPSILVDSKEELPLNFLKWVKKVGISSGASAPDSLVMSLIEHLKSLGGVFEKEIITKEEKMIFPYKIELS
jgi:4-hydroxy-3-methylbut-2-en-1-yl diphosphate reductase